MNERACGHSFWLQIVVFRLLTVIVYYATIITAGKEKGGEEEKESNIRSNMWEDASSVKRRHRLVNML